MKKILINNVFDLKNNWIEIKKLKFILTDDLNFQ